MQGGFGKTVGGLLSRQFRRAREFAALGRVQRHVFDDHEMLGYFDALDVVAAALPLISQPEATPLRQSLQEQAAVI